MQLDLASLWGKHVSIIDVDGESWHGLMQAYESVADSDDGVDSIDIVDEFGTLYNLKRTEIKQIEEDKA